MGPAVLAEASFWLGLACVAYVYAGYPVGVCVLALFVNRRVHKADVTPGVCVVVAAYNEEHDIERTVANLLEQDYPPELLNVIVVSDACTDHTEPIVLALAARYPGRLRLLRQDGRQGKTQALNAAVAQITREIVVFADANSIYAPGALRRLVRGFADPAVGYVTGKMVYTRAGTSQTGQGCGLYMRYENLLRGLETRLGSIVGVDGGIDAIRRELYVPMRADQLPDFVLPLTVVEQGRRVIYEPEAVVYEAALASAADEFHMRVRVSLRALWALYDKRGLLNPLRHPMFAWQLASHKALRYMAFVPLTALLAANVLVAGQHLFYTGFLALQAASYLLAVLGHLVRRRTVGQSRLLTPYYFTLLNVACVLAFWKFLHNQKMVVWKPRAGA